MDIYCPKCGEPWDLDSLHDQITERGYDYEAAKLKYPDSNERQAAYEKEWWNPILAEFKTKGCGSVFNVKFCSEKKEPHVAAISQAAFDIMGDDVDGDDVPLMAKKLDVVLEDDSQDEPPDFTVDDGFDL